MNPTRTLVIDEDLPGRLRTEIWRRGRNVERVKKYGLSGSRDPELLPALGAQLSDWILITGDDKMPLAHSAVVIDTASTIAIVDPRVSFGLTLDQWRREVVHKWVHKIHEQEAGTVRRYSYSTSRIWKPRK